MFKRVLPIALVALAALTTAPNASANALDIAAVDVSLPRVADFPGSGLNPRTEEVAATNSLRAPFPCADYTARGMRATSRWAEWRANGAGRRVYVLAFAYDDAIVGSAWNRLRAAIAKCPKRLPFRAANGSRGTSIEIVRSSTRTQVRLDIITVSASGKRDWGRERSIVYQRVGSVIEKITVNRPGRITTGDRAFARRIAKVSREQTIAVERDPEAAIPVEERPPAEPVGDTELALRTAVAAVPSGSTVNVSIGDSFISGEAGRWRGNVYWTTNSGRADFYGPEGYWDTPSGESIPGCHRAKGAEIHVPGTVGINLACSGAITTSKMGSGVYKPGIDDGMTDPTTGRPLPGQLTFLRQVSTATRVGTVVLSIGGNDMGFSDVIKDCLGAFATPWPFAYRCKDKKSTQDRLSDPALRVMGDKVEAAIVRVHATMQAAGYANGEWSLIVQNYPKPVAADNRYPETYADRLYRGGCPFYDADIRWINSRMPAMSGALERAARNASMRTGQAIRFLDLTDALAGRELCARGTEHVDRLPIDQVVARAERVQMIKVVSPFTMAEAVHPNQLGQQALQACLRAALNDGQPRSGRCLAPSDWSQVDATGLPLMRFTPTR